MQEVQGQESEDGVLGGFDVVGVLFEVRCREVDLVFIRFRRLRVVKGDSIGGRRDLRQDSKALRATVTRGIERCVVQDRQEDVSAPAIPDRVSPPRAPVVQKTRFQSSSGRVGTKRCRRSLKSEEPRCWCRCHWWAQEPSWR